MIEKTISNDHYEIGYDLGANRMYLRIKGFWKSPADVPEFVQDIDFISSKLRNGFTLLTDLRQMKTPPLSINGVHEEAQKVVNRNGLSKTAEILPESNQILDTVMKKVATDSGMRKQEFTTMRDAERWLDQISVNY